MPTEVSEFNIITTTLFTNISRTELDIKITDVSIKFSEQHNQKKAVFCALNKPERPSTGAVERQPYNNLSRKHNARKVRTHFSHIINVQQINNSAERFGVEEV